MPENTVQNLKNIELPISSGAMWMTLLILIIVFVIMYFVFSYHWKSVGIEENPKVFARPLFWIVSVLLIIVMTLSVAGFEYL
ncbi:MAG TPA: hypothetical protein PJ997_00390 [Candidatus Paceibacterota bacterium]|nr:hypothetical protein [Candidatus Paceibacterota bacterium]HMP18789.1 hypothetical protein [Candidatus Paceibacterota bacterium]HMP85457.1 hypothetical protein [Candidatus Paceibacterota bacterium]